MKDLTTRIEKLYAHDVAILTVWLCVVPTLINYYTNLKY